MRVLLSVVLLAVAPPALAREGGTDLEGRPAPEWVSRPECGQFVLVPQGSPLFAAPPALRAPAPLAGEPTSCCNERKHDPDVWVMRATALRGEWVEVETLGQAPDPGDHCAVSEERRAQARDRNVLSRYRLRLFVHRDSLLPVTRRAVAVKAADGSALWVKGGVPLERDASVEGRVRYKRRDVDERGFEQGRFTAELPEDAVGLSYWVSGVWGPWGNERFQGREAKALLLLGDAPLGVGDAARVEIQGREWKLLRGARPREYFAVSDGRCVSWQAKVPPQRVARPLPVPPGGVEGGVVGGVVGGVMGCVFVPPDQWRVEAGARVFWADGKRAGNVLARDVLQGPPHVNPRGHRCFDVTLEKSPTPLRMCFEPDEVQPVATACPG